MQFQLGTLELPGTCTPRDWEFGCASGCPGRLLEAREQAWDRQIEADAEAGKFDQLAEEALRDYREGKCIRLP